MNGNVSLFTKVLQNLSFRQGVDNKSKQFAFKYKRKALEITLKHYGDLTFIYSLVLRIYFFAKRTGHSLSIFQCRIILAVITLLSFSVIYSGIYFGFNLVNSKPAGTVSSTDNKNSAIDTAGEKTEIHSDNSLYIKENNSAKKNTPDNAAVRVGIEKYTGSAVDEKLLESITNTIADDLIKKHGGKNFIKLYKTGKDKNVNFLLTGSVEKLGSSYIINSKLINIENSEIIFITSNDVKDIDKIQKACLNISEKTAEEIK